MDYKWGEWQNEIPSSIFDFANQDCLLCWRKLTFKFDSARLCTKNTCKAGLNGQLRFGGHCYNRESACKTKLAVKLKLRGGVVAVNLENLNRHGANEDPLAILMLHESLCALQEPSLDDHYQISSIFPPSQTYHRT